MDTGLFAACGPTKRSTAGEPRCGSECGSEPHVCWFSCWFPSRFTPVPSPARCRLNGCLAVLLRFTRPKGQPKSTGMWLIAACLLLFCLVSTEVFRGHHHLANPDRDRRRSQETGTLTFADPARHRGTHIGSFFGAPNHLLWYSEKIPAPSSLAQSFTSLRFVGFWNTRPQRLFPPRSLMRQL
jgi:hypothetical protein